MKAKDVIALYTQECLEIHALLDRVHVPRTVEDGSVFSISQRVAIAVGVLENTLKQVGSKPVTLQ